MKHLRIVVRGRVQGVGFRYYTKHNASKYNISGYVSNKTDGSVLIEAEGEDINIELFLNWCRKGPDYARVNEVLASDCPVSGYTGFKIR